MGSVATRKRRYAEGGGRGRWGAKIVVGGRRRSAFYVKKRDFHRTRVIEREGGRKVRSVVSTIIL